MIDTYLDESGIHDGAAICVVAGCYSGKGQFRKLEKAWLASLRDYEFPLKDSHATDLLKSRRHQPMVQALAFAIGQQPEVYPVSFGIIVDDFNSFSEKQRRWFTGARLDEIKGNLRSTGSPNKPYFVPFQECVRAVAEHAPVGGKAGYIVGQYALTLFKHIKERAEKPDPLTTWKSKDRVGNITALRASETPELQEADLLVHLTYQHMLERHAANDWNVQPSGLLAECMRNMRFLDEHTFLNRECLRERLEQSRAIVGNWDSA